MPTIDQIDHASQQNDHWLFLAALMFIIGASIVAWRWMVADREKLARRLTEITDRHITSCENLGKVVEANTVVLRRVEGKL